MSDSTHLAVAADADSCGIFDVTNGTQTTKLPIGQLAISEDGKEAIVRNRTLQYFDTQDGKLLRQGTQFFRFLNVRQLSRTTEQEFIPAWAMNQESGPFTMPHRGRFCRRSQ